MQQRRRSSGPGTKWSVSCATCALAALHFASPVLAQQGENPTAPTDEPPKAETPAADTPAAPKTEAPPAQEPEAEAPHDKAPATAPLAPASERPTAPSTGRFADTPQASDLRNPAAAASTKSRRALEAQPSSAPLKKQKPAKAARSTSARDDVEDSENGATAPASNSDQELEPASRDDVAKEEDDDNGGLLGPIRLGPMVGVGLPNLLSFGGLLKITRYLGGGINIGLIPTVRISYYGDAKLLYQEYDVFGRIFPFGGGFFVGAGVGYETVRGTLTDSMSTASLPPIPGVTLPSSFRYDSAGSVRTLVLTPQIGYFYTTKIGFSIGLDVGAQLPIAPSQITVHGNLSPNSSDAVGNAIRAQFTDPTNKKVYDTLQTIGRTPLPTFNIRIGWLL